MEQAAIGPKSYSGKWTTAFLLVSVLVTGGLFFWVVNAYSVYNAARRQTERDWREVATALDERYRKLDTAIETHQSSGPLNAQLNEQWQAARRDFSGSALPVNQIKAAQKLELLIDELPDELQAPAVASDELGKLVDAYAKSAQNQREVGQQSGSQLLKTLLNLPDPLDLQLSR